MFRTASISPTALSKIRSLVRSAGRGEVGGPMVGYRDGDENLVILDVSGPGVNGKCLPYNVTIDGEHSTEFCDKAYARSNGVVDFVGDWHCHPGFSVSPSAGDHTAMKTLAETPGLVSNPASLIYSSFLGSFRIYRWDSRDQRLVAVPRRKFRRPV